jgi:ComF family protein
VKVIFSKLYQGLIDLIFPKLPQCPVCGKEFNHGEINLCKRCIDKINFIKEDYCLKCGKLILPNQEFCYDCQHSNHYFDQARSVGLYDSGLKEYIKLFKYSKYRTLTEPLGDLMSSYTNRFYNINDFDIITYVPVHKKRLDERGFNQAFLLAKRIGENLKIDVESLLIRNKDTIKQSKLSRKERLRNLKSKFKIKGNINIDGKRILLVDDVYTTGATVNELSRILLNNRAESIKVITLASGRDLNLKRKCNS